MQTVEQSNLIATKALIRIMTEAPSYEVFTRQKLLTEPISKKKVKRRLAFRPFRESELTNLNEVLHESNIDLQG